MNQNLDKEYLHDYLHWQYFLENHKLNKNELCDLIISNQDPLLACFFAFEKKYKQYIMQKIVLDSKKAKYAFLFAKLIKNADVNSLLQIAVKTNNILYITKFVLFFNLNSDYLKKLILNSKKIKYIHMLMKHESFKDINKNIIFYLKSNKIRYLIEVANYVNSKNLKKIESLIIKSKSSYYIRLFATKIKNVNINRLEKEILILGDSKEIKKFAKNVKNSSIKKFLILN